MRQPPNLIKDTPASRAAPTHNSADRQTPTNYLDLYGLSRPPFGSPPDHAGYILFGSHRRAFESVIDHMVNGAGLLLIQGPEGIGKSQTLHAAASVAGESGLQAIVVSRPPGGRTNISEFISALIGQVGEHANGAPDAVQHFLQPPRKALLIDDFDLLPDECIELLQSLVPATTDPAGSPVVATTTIDPGSGTARPQASQIAALARNTIRLPPLGPAEIRQYIERSLWVAGGTTRRLITPDAIKLIIARSGGLPGVVDRLMEAAFTAGYARGDSMITAKTVTAAMGPIAPRLSQRERSHAAAAGHALQIVSAGLLLIGASMFLYRGLIGQQQHMVQPPSTSTSTKPFQPKAAPPKLADTPAPQSPPVTTPPANQLRNTKSSDALSPALIAALIKRGDQSVDLGDIAAARLLFQRAAEAGNAAATAALGKTYDPNFVQQGPWADPARAVELYRKATTLGDPHAQQLSNALTAH